MRLHLETLEFSVPRQMPSVTDIDNFFSDRAVQGAIEASRESRPLQICYPSEIPVSRFLAWLLDPTQGHGLNGAILRRLLTACWDIGTDEALPIKTKEKIAPRRLATQSFADAVVDLEVNFLQNTSRVDVMILLPSIKLAVAIENKTGAKESLTQLQRYRKGLREVFGDWDHVMVYLDINGAQPRDSAWIGLDYDWLIEELSIAERSSWLGEEPRRAIMEFRHAIDRNSAEEGLPGIDERNLLEMVLAHPRVFGLMAKWARSGKSHSSLAAEIFGNNSADCEVQRCLFPLYSRRTRLWQQCIPLMASAILRKAAQGAFDDLKWDPKRSAFYFALKRWEPLEREGTRYWPLQVMVREQFSVKDTERFVVISHLYFENLADEYVDAAASTAVLLRAKWLKAKKMTTRVRRASLRVDYSRSQEEAASVLRAHLTELDKYFSPLLLR